MPAADQRLYWLHALSPLHVGTGRGEGYIDLPLAREKVTRLPFVPGSAVKGVFADSHGASQEKRKEPIHIAAFGQAERGEVAGNSNAGALVLTDARLVCLPVRSLYGTFAWCTSAFVLRRLARDYDAAGFKAPEIPTMKRDDAQAMSVLVTSLPSVLSYDGRVFLEDLDGKAEFSALAVAWAIELAGRLFPTANDPWRTEFVQRFAVLPDDIFNALCETGTEVQPTFASIPR